MASAGEEKEKSKDEKKELSPAEQEAQRAADDAKKAAQEKEDRAKVKLKKGAYQVQVHLIEARDLKGRGSGDSSDPVFEVKVLDKKESSRIYKKQLAPLMNETMYFEWPALNPGEVEAGKVHIDVKDSNTIRRDVLIGSFSFDLTRIYYMPHHEMFRQWVALTDITGKFPGIQGYLKLSVVVLHEEDEQHTHTAAEEDDEGSDMMAVLLPPTVEQTPMVMRFQVHEVASLPAMDEGIFGSLCDPYVKIEYNGMSVKTHRKKGQTAVIGEEITLPVFEPVMSNTIRVHVYDWDLGGGDDRITSFSLHYDDIKGNGLPPKWFQMYGAPEGEQSNKEAKQMNKNFIEGSFYRGRCLISGHVEAVPEGAEPPEKGVETCSGLTQGERPPEALYRLQFDLYEGSEIAEKGKMRVEMSCGNMYFSSREVEPVGGRAKWYDVIKADGKEIDLKLPADLDQCPDVIVYLAHKKKRLSFRRFKFREVVERGWKVPPSWYILKEDPVYDAFDASKAEFPGSLMFSLRAGIASTAPPVPFPESRPLNSEETYSALSGTADDLALMAAEAAAPSVGEGVSQAGTLTLEVLEGRDLPIMDKTSSDPYVKLRMGAHKFKTKVINQNLNPKWNETFIFPNVPLGTPLTVEVFDADKLGKDEQMGRVEIDLRTQQKHSSSRPGHDFVTDDWFLISDAHPNAAVRFRFRFKFLPLEQSRAVMALAEKEAGASSGPATSRMMSLLRLRKTPQKVGDLGAPESAQYQLRFHLYQARKLPATDSSGLCDAFAIVRLCGKVIKTKIKKETVNPMWYETYSVNVELPIPLSLSPDIQCYFFDYDQFSKNDVLGRLSVSVSDAFKMNPSVLEVSPRWFELRDWNDDVVPDARVLCSFQLVDARDAAVPLPNINPPTIPMYVELTTLGFRNLTSKLGVHKTFASFELPNGKKMKTDGSKNPNSKNPNFLQVLKIPVDLPIDKMFAPSLDIEAIDTLAGGLLKRRIGTAALDLADFMKSADDDSNPEDGEWTAAPQIEVLDEKVLQKEIAEMEAQRRAEEERKMKEKTDQMMAAVLAAEASAGTGTPIGSPRERARLLDEKPAGGSSSETQELPEPDIHDIGLGELPEIAPLKPAPASSAAPPAKGGSAKVAPEEMGTVAPAAASGQAQGKVKPGDDDGEEEKENAEPEPEALESDRLLVPTAAADDEEQPEYMKGRPIVDNELEDVMSMKPFNTIPLFTGQKNAGPLGEEYHQVGVFKGLVRLLKDKDEPSPFNLQELLMPQDFYLRIYILDALKLVPTDPDGSSDPYLKVMIGDKKYSTRDRYIKNNLNPDLYESFEIPVTIPGDAVVTIQCWDYDGIGDDLIGETHIDIEDRWFDKNWRKMPLKPLEIRTLRSKSSSISQGKIRLWVEIVDMLYAKKNPMIVIKPPPPVPHELRVIVWGVRNMACTDPTSGLGDLYVTGIVSTPGFKKQETDTHLRAKKGKGNFNWRLVWKNLLLPPPDKVWPRLTVSVWDADLLSANDAIATSTISLKGLCKEVMKKKDQVKIIVKGKDRIWIEKMAHPNYPGEDRGKAELTVELMPSTVAEQVPAGLGRDAPNANPFLPPPEGRLKLSLLHPIDMLRDLLGDRLFFKIVGICCAAAVMSACFFVAPMIFSQVVSNAISPF